MHQLKNSNWRYIHTGLNLKSNICRSWKWARNWRNQCCRDHKLWPQQVVMSHSTETTSKGSSHLIDAKTDLPRWIKLHIRLHLNTSYDCSSCSHACKNGKKKKKKKKRKKKRRYMIDKNGEPQVWRTQKGNDKKNNDQNVNKKQGKKHTRKHRTDLQTWRWKYLQYWYPIKYRRAFRAC